MSDTGVSPNKWGRLQWHLLHLLSFNYPVLITDENINKKREMYEYLVILGDVLPCSMCKVHYKENIGKPIGGLTLIEALDSREKFSHWMYDLHNLVNKQTNVPESKWPSYNSVKKIYSELKENCAEIPGVCGSNNNDPFAKKIGIVEYFGDVCESDIKYIVITSILGAIIIILIVYINCRR